MAHISQVRRCYNCGAVLQSEDPSKEGYVKKETLENASQNFLFCDKCFEKERYHSQSNEPSLNPEFLTMLKDAKKKNALIVYVINLFSFEASFSSALNEVIQGMNILVVGNKFDLLPEGCDEESTKEYVAHRFRAVNVTISKDNVVIANAFDDETARSIIQRIYELKNGKDVYVIGPKLAGKTTLISSFLRVYKNLSTGNIVTQEYPGTSLRVMQIPLSSRSCMYDTPGIDIDNSILHELDKTTLNNIYLTESVKPRTITFAAGQAVYFGGLAFIELVKGKKTEFVCYFHDRVQIKRVNAKKAENKFVQLVAHKSLKPSLSKIKSIKDMDVFEVEITESNYRDIGIQGLGWFTFLAKGQLFRIYVPHGVSVFTSRPKVHLKK